MLMLAGSLVGDEQLKNPTIVVVTDRNDLDGQLFGTFAAGRALLRQRPDQAEDRKDLAKKLNRASGGVIFTTIQKFEERGDSVRRAEPTSWYWRTRHTGANTAFSMAGRAGCGLRFRTQPTWGSPERRWKQNWMGTRIRGPCLDPMRMFTTSRRRCETVPPCRSTMKCSWYPCIPMSKGCKRRGRIGGGLCRQCRGNRSTALSSRGFGGAGQKLGSRLGAAQIVEHFEKRREVIEGKAMAVCMSREICMDLYDYITALRPDWHSDDDDAGFVKVVMDSAIPGQRKNEKKEDYEKRIAPLVPRIWRSWSNKRPAGGAGAAIQGSGG